MEKEEHVPSKAESFMVYFLALYIPIAGSYFIVRAVEVFLFGN